MQLICIFCNGVSTSLCYVCRSHHLRSPPIFFYRFLSRRRLASSRKTHKIQCQIKVEIKWRRQWSKEWAQCDFGATYAFSGLSTSIAFISRDRRQRHKKRANQIVLFFLLIFVFYVKESSNEEKNVWKFVTETSESNTRNEIICKTWSQLCLFISFYTRFFALCSYDLVVVWNRRERKATHQRLHADKFDCWLNK